MKTMNLKLITVITYFFLPLVVMKSEVKIVPYPQEIIEYGYHIKLPSEINLQTDKLFTNELGLFEKIVQEEFRFVLKDNPKASFSLRMVKDTSCCSEGYKIKIDSHDICLSAASNTGMFYALQSLRQLARKDKSESLTFPALEIADYPYFSWRGFMLDDARAFKGVEIVKNLLDEMSLMKMNVFQWHLTEDQGWRIEIKKYPLLTEIGGRRDSTQLDWYENDRYDGTPLEGFYTQQQIKEIVEYAADRHITIVPEIEMPGHCSSAIASYPWLGCSGKQIRVPCDFGVMYDVFNVADTRVIQFLEDVLDEISTLFPSGIIHIGGDEVRYDQWNASAQIQEYMKQKKISSCAALQVDFTNDMARRIERKGKRMMGWNDITGDKLHHYQQGDVEVKMDPLSDKALIQFWLGDDNLIQKAARRGHDIVNSFHEYTYLNYNHDRITPGKEYSFAPIPLQKAYSFSPIPKSLPESLQHRILGLSCQMWGEWIPSVKQMNKMIYPYWAAHAETGWLKPEKKDYDRFLNSMDYLTQRWIKKGYYIE